MFIGPFAMVLLRFWKGILLLLTPIVFCSGIAYLFLDGHLPRLLRYPLTLQVWGAIYWLICIVAVTEEVKLQNRMDAEEPEIPRLPSPVEIWLRENPGKSVNDYYKYN